MKGIRLISNRKLSRTILPLLAALVLLAIAPGAAQAASMLTLDGATQLDLDPAAGVENVVTLAGDAAPDGGATTVVISDTGDTIDVEAELTAPCEGEGTNTVTCSGGEYQEWDIDLGDLDDELSGTGTMEFDASGEEGNDTLRASETTVFADFTGGAGNDTLVGGANDDELSANEGNDSVDGRGGADLLFDETGDGTDSYQGGDGIDEIEYFAGDPGEVLNVDLNAGTAIRTGGETDALAGIEDVDTTGDPSGNDTLTGSSRANELDANEGNDNVNPLGGGDIVFLNEGDDTADLRDGAADRVFCAEGTDTVQADQFDVLEDCENTTVTNVRPEGADLIAPDCTVRRVKRTYARNAFFKGFRPDVDCNEAATLDIALVATVKRGKLITARVGDIVLAQKRVVPGGNVGRVKAAKRFARQLKKNRGFRARLVVEATDQYGNTTTETKRIKVKKAKRKRARKRRG